MAQTNLKSEDLKNSNSPQNLEAEASLLGALLIDPEAIVKIADTITTEDFYDPKHRYIYDSMLQLYNDHNAIDVLTLSDRLANNDHLDSIGGPSYLTELTNFVPTASHVEQYADIVAQKALRRRLIATSKEITELSRDESKVLRELIEEAESKLFNVSQQHIKQNVVSLEAILAESFDRLDDLHKDKQKIRGIPTGFKDLDNTLAGFQRSDLVILAARPSMGKAQPLDSKVLTTVGWKQMGSLKVGDKLASIDEKPSTVTGIFPQKIEQIYKITFSDGRSAEASAEHLWKVRYPNWDEPKVLTTNEVTSYLEKKSYRNRLSIDLFEGNFGHNLHLPIDPWILGALIGEGHFSDLRFPSATDHILQKIKSKLTNKVKVVYAENYDYRLQQIKDYESTRRTSAWPKQLEEELKGLNLWDKHSSDKFVPEIYKQSTRTSRLALLQGLLDAGGSLDKRGTIRYSTSSSILADDVVDLARSLGAWATKKPKYRADTYMGVKKKGSESYVVNIVSKWPDELFSLPEKQSRVLTRFRRKRHPVIKSIEPVRKAMTQCISVSHESQLYITDNYVVTHNTAMALNFAHNIASQTKEPVLIFSLEMSKEQLVDRLLSMESGVDAWALRTGNLTDSDFEKIGRAMGNLSEAPIYIDDTPGITVSDLRTKARREAHKHPLGLIIVDYLQLMSGSGSRSSDGNRVQEISEISRGLKGIARELNVPLLALSQLSRSVESRSPQIPQLADLRESGSIEQDADVVAFIYREEYYNPETDRKRLTDVLIKKHRNGPTGGVELYFDTEKQRFRSVDTKHQEPKD